MKKQKSVFFRTLYISLTVAFCFIFGVFFAARAYENTKMIGFGENKKAIEISDGFLFLFDFKVPLRQPQPHQDNRNSPFQESHYQQERQERYQ